MEVLQVLEKKVVALAELIQELKKENVRLVEENIQLLAKLDSLETSVLQESEVNQEATRVIDSLIENIDSLVTENQQQ